jgi:hypothetical protein
MEASSIQQGTVHSSDIYMVSTTIHEEEEKDHDEDDKHNDEERMQRKINMQVEIPSSDNVADSVSL